MWAGALHGEMSKHPFKESSKKKSLKPIAASHTNTSWYTDTDGFLEYSPSREGLLQGAFYKRPTLQKIIPGFLGSLSYIMVLFLCLASIFFIFIFFLSLTSSRKVS